MTNTEDMNTNIANADAMVAINADRVTMPTPSKQTRVSIPRSLRRRVKTITPKGKHRRIQSSRNILVD
jgi:hypothetical protein